jgi:periplasmic protein TonB
MFDLITGTMERPLRERSPRSTAVSLMLHVVVLTLVIGIPLLRVTNTLPDLPTIMAFAAAAPAPPPPPPPPPAPAAARPTEPRPTVRPVAMKPEQLTVPLETPAEVKPEATTGTASPAAGVDGGVAGGVAGGVEGGVVGGVLGGILGGIISSVPPPPPAPVAPVRVGGQINTPALVHRVEPIYPEVAAAAKLAGTVILEAVVGTNGSVESVNVLRSRNVLLDKAAVAALKQWRYTPLVLNGIPTPFVLTVTFTFSTR